MGFEKKQPASERNGLPYAQKRGAIGEESREMTNPNRQDGKRLDALSNPQKMVLLFEAVALTRGWEAFVMEKIGPAKFAGCLFLGLFWKRSP